MGAVAMHQRPRRRVPGDRCRPVPWISMPIEQEACAIVALSAA
jgi:hypothetical protein